MVSAVREGKSLREVAATFGVHHSTVAVWVQHADGKRLDRVDFSDKPRLSPPHNRTIEATENIVIQVRKDLKEHSPLGEYGAQAIRGELVAQCLPEVPSVRTIGRILDRCGALDGKVRVRRPPPPKGWYLPPVVELKADIDSFDLIEDLRIENGPLVDVFTGTSVLGRLPLAWPAKAQMTAKSVLETLLGHWRQHGLPDYAQFDNDTRFQGPHQYPDVISRVMRVCLSLGVIPVFAPPRESGFQASIENFNGRWEQKVWLRFHHPSLRELRQRSKDYVIALRGRHACSIENGPPRRDFPHDWLLDLQAPLSGRIIYLRRSTTDGFVSLLGHTFQVSSRWPNRLVRCEVGLDDKEIQFFALRRREPREQPMLSAAAYQIPRRAFKE
jgi:putative transposase